MIAVAALLGYAVGSIPSADWLAAAQGFDLRRDGTRNPGTANAIGLGGLRLGAPILMLDFLKGIAAALIGLAAAGAGGAAAAGVAATAGQILNPWFGFRGGKGLAVAGGVGLALLPAVTVTMLGVVAVLMRTVRPAASAVLLALAAAVALTVATTGAGAPWDWSALPGSHRVALVAGMAVLAAPKFAADLADHRRTAQAGR